MPDIQKETLSGFDTCSAVISSVERTVLMKAARFYGQEDIRVEYIPIPSCGPNQVRIKPAFVGICGTDVNEYQRGPTLIPIKPHPLTGVQAPVTIGHEISGIVDEVGLQVEDLAVGDHVAVQPIISDAICAACRRGNINCCRQQGFYGLSKDGGLAEYLVVSRKNLKRIPPEIPLHVAALIEPLAVGWRAVNRCAADSGHAALVIGAGPIGLAIILALRVFGVNPIIASDTSSKRRSLAQEIGADVALDPLTDDVVCQCQLLCDGEGVHLAFDTAGVQDTLNQAISACRSGGRITNVAIWGDNANATISPNAFALGEKTYAGTAVYTDEDFETVIAAIASGLLDPSRMITKSIALDNLVKDGIHALINDKENQVKILVAPNS